MSTKPSSELDPLDLMLRARSSALRSEEELALERALALSAALRTAHELGRDLDFACRVRARDQVVLDRALDRALTSPAQRRTHRLPRFAGILAATLVVASAAAATHAVVALRLAPATPVNSVGHSAPPLVKPPTPRSVRGPAPSGPSAVVLPMVTSESARAPLPPSRPSLAGATAISSTSTAADLFREAGAARRSGDVARARALYMELESRFPASNEAAVSHVSLGNLLLTAGAPAAAEKAFKRYLLSGQGSLREESLAGVAEALLAMGRINEERRAREDLLRLDPVGVYASRARRRIAEIDEARARSATER